MVEPRNSTNVNTSKVGANLQYHCFSYGERRHVSYAFKRRVNLAGCW